MQATATANSAIDLLQITNGGTGYTSAPNINITGASSSPSVTGGISSISLTADSSVGGAGNLVINPPIMGGGNLTKIGAGTVTLNAASSFSGNTTVSAGTLVVANTTGSATSGGNVILNGGTLASGLVGSISGSVLAGTGAHVIAPGGVGSVGTLTIGGLTTSNLTTLSFDLGAGPASTVGTSNVVTNGDLLVLGGAGTIGTGTTLSFTGTPVPTDDYRLIGDTNSGSIVNGLTIANFTLPTAPNGDTYSLSTTVDPGYLDLVVGASVSSGPATLTFNNAGGSGDGATWDIATSQNFNNGTAAVVYHEGDIVTFNDANNGHYNVALNTVVHPKSVTVSTAGAYTHLRNRRYSR